MFVLCRLLFPSSGWASGTLSHEVYVWQRAWTPSVCQAVSDHAACFSETVVLMAEVSWKGAIPQVARAHVDLPALGRIHRPVGLALRVGAVKGGLATNSYAVTVLGGLADLMVAEARKNQIQPVELQIDYDCATARLDDYRILLKILQKRFSPLPVTFTALPAWLEAPSFARLVQAAPNYVLQVHSLQDPAAPSAPATLCDPAAAQRAVRRAGEIGVSFRVALPTYSYLLAYNAAGNFIGLSAESSGDHWPEGSQIRELRTDPAAMSRLVQGWNANPPPFLRGIIWYRLPVAVDNMNWRWPTLSAIVAGHQLRQKVHAAARRVGPGLLEISLVNDGELDRVGPVQLSVNWSGARLSAGDGLRGFELVEQPGTAALLQCRSAQVRLPAGERWLVGWMRFDRDTEVELDVEKN